MKVIFLDIDGVLCTQESMRVARELGNTAKSSRQREAFYEPAVAVFNKFIESTGAKVVISSAWRTAQTVQSMQEMFDRNNIKCEIIGLTPDDPDGIRGLEIWSWLLNNREKWTDYLVIDDEGFDIANYIPANKFVHVKDGLMGYGLEERHLARLAKKLNITI